MVIPPKLLRLLFTIAAVFYCSSAMAVQTQVGSTSKPVMLTADEMTYNEATSTAIATGHVEVVQDGIIMLADKLSYNQNTDEIHAVGHVSIVQPTGDVVFADDAVLQKTMQTGVVEAFKARLKDNSLFAAREAHKINKNITVLDHAVYSPCHVCATTNSAEAQAPLWQVEAEKVTIDEGEQRVRYRNAFMELYGVPIAYTPYFSNPTPDAPSQSGLLIPQYYHSSTLGNVIKQPAYFSIDPSQDLTLTPWYLSEENPLIQGEYRRLWDGGFIEARGAITDAHNRDADGNIISGTQLRDYIDIHSREQLSEHWSVGLDAQRTSDDTFLQVYSLGWQSLLTSRLYAERIEDRDYAVIEGLAFQGLQPQDTSTDSPYALPHAAIHKESEPLAWNSRLVLDGDALVLERQEGTSDQRISATGAWNIPYITAGGQVLEAKFSTRGDGYSVDNQVTNTATNETFNGTTGRVIPQAELDWKYPLIKRFDTGQSLMIAPVAEMAISPDLRTNSDIPNEDSRIAELSNINLFSLDRFSGLDEVESGFRAVYGTRGNLQFADDKYVDWLFGQTYIANPDDPFPISQTPMSSYSDYIGNIEAKYKWISVSYGFGIDRSSGSLTSNDLNVGFVLAPVTLNATFIDLQNEPLFGETKAVFGNAAIDVTKNWKWTFTGRKDLGSSTTTSNTTNPNSTINNNSYDILTPGVATPGAGTVGLGTGIIYHNECLTVTTNIAKNYISLQDVRPSTTFSVDVVLKSFGDPAGVMTPDSVIPGSEKQVTNYDQYKAPNATP